MAFGPYSASIAGVGASLRALTHNGRPLVRAYEAEQVRPGDSGAVLAPWPNRVVDGQYYFDGQPHVLALSEPPRGHALHGLAAWATWDVVEHSEAAVRLAHTIAPQDGYPFRLSLEATYTLSGEGLTWEVSATNTGTGIAPYGAAPHPYLVAGEGLVDEWTVHIPARQVLAVTPDRLIPISLREVQTHDGGSLDFREPRTVGPTYLDHAYTDIAFDDGAARVEVYAPSGSGVAMTWDTASPWVQVHTPQAPGIGAWRSALAVEPMTCPPDAFNSHTDLVRLAPGESHTAAWGIHAL